MTPIERRYVKKRKATKKTRAQIKRERELEAAYYAGDWAVVIVR